MINRLKDNPISEHASNLGGLIAYDIAIESGICAYIYDSVAVDELIPYAKVTGIPEIERMSHGHALNMRAAAIKTSKKIGKKYSDCSFIVAHLGGGFTTSLHQNGKMVDIVGDEEGSFSPERSGGIQVRQLAKFIMSWTGDKKELKKKLRGNTGLKALLGTADVREVEKMIDDGNEYAKLVYESMAYQVAKGVGCLAAAAKGNVDRIIITGGIAYSKNFIQQVCQYIKFIAPIEILPGEDEMESLTMGILRVLMGEEEAIEYEE
jgi:butyrate kinase